MTPDSPTRDEIFEHLVDAHGKDIPGRGVCQCHTCGRVVLVDALTKPWPECCGQPMPLDTYTGGIKP